VGGLEIATHRLAERLIRKGVAVSLVTSRRNPDWPAHERLASGLEVFRLRQEAVPRVGTALYMVRLAAFLWRRRSTYDVVHTCFIDPSTLVSAFMKRLTGRPTICRLSGAQQTGDVRRLENASFKRLWTSILGSIDRFVALSREMEEELLQNGFDPVRIRRIPNGVDTEHFRPASEEERLLAHKALGCAERKPILVYSGRLSPEKGPEDLLIACQQVVDKEPGALLLFLGEGPLRQRLEEHTRELGLSEHVRFLGNVANVRDHLHAADLFVLPSRAEGMSNALLEAMACGLPCVATRVSGMEELVGKDENGCLVPPGRPDLMGEMILRLWRSPEEARRVAHAAREKIEVSYSLDFVAEQYLALYRECFQRAAQTRPV
jgi:glycosyltransferase involved in cell wall biosynthesis